MNKDDLLALGFAFFVVTAIAMFLLWKVTE